MGCSSYCGFGILQSDFCVKVLLGCHKIVIEPVFRRHMFDIIYSKPMKPNHYTEIPSTFEIFLEPLKDYSIHKHISARGIRFIHPSDIEVATILKISLKMVSMTGELDFIVKVLKSTKVEGEPLFEIHCNFYDTNAEKEDEVLELIKSYL